MSCPDISDQPQVEGLCQHQFPLSASGLEGDVPNNHSKKCFDSEMADPFQSVLIA